MQELTLAYLKREAGDFVRIISAAPVSSLYHISDGRKVVAYIEQAFHKHLQERYTGVADTLASGIDFPGLDTDMKTFSVRLPQSMYPYRYASQKIYGLGYHLLIFIYEKSDHLASHTAHLSFPYTLFLSRERTADYQTTYGLREILRRGGSRDDITTFLEQRGLPLDDIGRELLADHILLHPPEIGYLTVSNALQWRLQYGRAIGVASHVEGVESLL
jgi:hypothetical protein